MSNSVKTTIWIKRIIGTLFLVGFLSYLGNKLITEYWDRPDGGLFIFLASIVVLGLIFAIVRVLNQ